MFRFRHVLTATAAFLFLPPGCGNAECDAGFVLKDDGECYPDNDADGFTAAVDCDDSNGSFSPAGEDVVGDGVDQDCDGVDGTDYDGDGVAGLHSGGTDCDDGDPAVVGEDTDGDGAPWCTDCNDSNVEIHPNALDGCDGIDDNCDGRVDVDPNGVGACVLDTTAIEAMDVLIIVDNSCSMSQEQALLASNVENIVLPFLDRGIDFHLGVVSTDVQSTNQSGRLQASGNLKWVDQSTPDPVGAAGDLIVLGTSGSADERGRDAAYQAIEIHAAPGGYNEGFIREEADLAILAISDEDDHSNSIPLQEFIDWAQLLKDGPVVSFHSIVSPSPVCAGASEPGDNYIALTTALGGEEASICDPDYSPVLDAIAQNWSPTVIDGGYLLPYPVDPTSLAATVTPMGAPSIDYTAAELDWDLATLTVTLPVAPPPGSEVQIWYAPAAVEVP